MPSPLVWSSPVRSPTPCLTLPLALSKPPSRRSSELLRSVMPTLLSAHGERQRCHPKAPLQQFACHVRSPTPSLPTQKRAYRDGREAQVIDLERLACIMHLSPTDPGRWKHRPVSL